MRLPLLVGSCVGYSILIHSGMGSRSHAKGMLEVGQALGARGHWVQYVALDDNIGYARDHPNITEVGLGHPGAYRSQLVLLESQCQGKVGDDFNYEFLKLIVGWTADAYRHEYLPLLNHVRGERPDVMVCDFLASACQEVAEAEGIPLVIGMQALDYFGIFNAPYLTKDPRFGPLTIEGMSFTQRLLDTVVVSFHDARLWASAAAAMAKERRAVGSKATWHPKGAFHYGVGLANSFFGFDAAQPLPPNVKVIGPIMASQTTPLDPPLLEFFEHHPRVMFVAFGSLLSLQPRETGAILKGALEAMHLGYIDGLIWGLGKTSTSNFPTKSAVNHDFSADSRFKFLAWAPQQAILDHPNTILFLSHGGIESIFEAIHAQTPILSLPFLGDQPRNAAKLQAMGIGIHVNPHNINLTASITTLLTHPTLHANLIKAQALVKFHPRRLQDAANFIEEHLELARTCRPHFPHMPPCETSHLLPAHTHLSFIFANRIDIYLTLLALSLALLATLLPLLQSMFYRMTAIARKIKAD